MPIPIAAAVAAGAELLTGGISAYAQGRTNKKTRQWNEKMYGIQRRDALADYNMQNAYNSPTSQMARLREAGLNPNLVYGDGANAPSATIRSTDAKPWTPHAPDIPSGGRIVSTYYDTQLQQANLDNLKKQNTVIEQEAMLKAAQIQNTIASTGMTTASTARSKFDLSQANALAQNSLDMADANLRKVWADTDMTVASNNRAEAMTNMSLKEGAERVLRSMAERSKIPAETAEILKRIQNIDKDVQLKELDLRLKRNGIQPNDPLYFRALAQYFNISPDKVQELIK